MYEPMKREAERLVTLLPNFDNDPAIYAQALRNVEGAFGLAKFIEELGVEEECRKAAQVIQFPPVLEKPADEMPAAEPAPVAVEADPEPVAVETPAPAPAPVKTYSADAVKAALSKARLEKNLNLPELFNKFGANKFSELKPEQYEALLTEAGVSIDD